MRSQADWFFSSENGAPGTGHTPFWVQCKACTHIWPAAYLPMEAGLLCKVTKGARCPKCGYNKQEIARQDNGVLARFASSS